MYDCWYDYVKPRYLEKAKSCYVDIDSFTVHVKSEDMDKDPAGNVQKSFDASNYEVKRSLTIRRNNLD